MSGYALALVLAVVVLLLLVQLMRRRRIKEKYAAMWIALILAICVMAIFPHVAFWVAHLVGVETPANLLFAAALAVLLGVCLQLSGEVSTLEEKTRILAEEVALLRAGQPLPGSDSEHAPATDELEAGDDDV